MYLTKRIGMVNKLMSTLSYERTNHKKALLKENSVFSSLGTLNAQANISGKPCISECLHIGIDGGFSYGGYSKASMRSVLYSNIRGKRS